MGQVAVNVNGRLYRFDCGDGEEQRLEELVAYVRARIESLAQEYGSVGDDRLFLTAALLTADELFDARAELAEAQSVTETLRTANETLKGQLKKATTPERTEKPEADALRAEFRRKIAASDG
jgi:cell division protein ZapA